MKEFIIIGGGIGGAASAAMLAQKGHDVALLEKEPYLGGCSSTFTHGKYRYNTGATTFAGYGEGLLLHDFFHALHVRLPIEPIDPALTVISPQGTVHRHQDLSLFLDSLNATFYHKDNGSFWTLVRDVTSAFLSYQGYWYSHASWVRYTRSLLSFMPVAKAFWPYLLQRADTLFDTLLPNHSIAYRTFLESQLLIITQAPSQHINALSALLALGYTFLPNHYVQGGMGMLFNALEQHIPTVHKQTTVKNIVHYKNNYHVYTDKGMYMAQNVVLNTPTFCSSSLFDQKVYKDYFDSFAALDNDQSAFMVYFTLKSEKRFCHHYQLIQEKPLPLTLSQALFVSFSSQNDSHIAPSGHYSITVSIHTKTSWWKAMDKTTYTQEKKLLVSTILDRICDTLDIDKSEIVTAFGATPLSFERYLHRSQLGGIPMSVQRPFYKNPANDTPFEGLYLVGDTTFAAQGWPGVIAGVRNLERIIHG